MATEAASKAGADVTTVVKSVLTRIKEAQSAKQSAVAFDMSDCAPRIVSQAIQQMLAERGFVVMVVHGSDPRTERMYVDLSRRRGQIPG